MMEDALKGIRILEVGTMTPGKFTGFLLTGWGAKSLRIERPSGPQDPAIGDEDLTLNRGKQSIALNLREPRGRDILLQLAAKADVFMESYRPGTAARLGIDAEAVRALNSRIVYCSLSGFGQTGPDRLRAAYDLNQQAETGFSHALAGGGTPVTPDTYIADSISGLMAAFAISAVLRQREITGEGATIDLGIQESLFALLAVSHGTLRTNTPAQEHRAAYGSFEAANDTSLSLGVSRKASADALFKHLRRPDLADEGLLRGVPGAAARAFLTEALRAKPASDWITELAPLDIEISIVHSPESAFDNAQLIKRAMTFETIHPIAGTLRQIGIPGVDARRLTPAPLAGADTDAVLGELDYGPTEIAELKISGVI
jgi:crotonobetainyl-CoA:carnitine CoA-transferase CaiB-like acyl-CoA transferase